MAQTDYSYFIGDWKNSNGSSNGIDSFRIAESEDGPKIEVIGIEGGFFPGNWGKAKVQFLVSGPHHTTASAFQACFRNGNKQIFLAGNINKGLIIIAIYAMAEQGDPNLFVREFYYKK